MRVFLHHLANTRFRAKLGFHLILRMLLRCELGTTTSFHLRANCHQPRYHRVRVFKDHKEALRESSHIGSMEPKARGEARLRRLRHGNRVGRWVL